MAPPRTPNPYEDADAILAAVRAAGGVRGLAREHDVSQGTARRWLDDHEVSVASTRTLTRSQVLGKVSKLIERSGIDLDDVERVERIRLNEWEGFMKGEDGKPVTVPLEAAQVILEPKRPDGPAWPVVQPADPVVIRPARRRPSSGSWRTAVILPDPQIGYRRDLETAELDPFHDERAIDAALALVAELQPDLIVNLGDVLDLPALSRFVKEPAFALTTQESVHYATGYLARQRASAPNAEIRYMEGNHEARLPRQIMENAGWAFGLKRGRLDLPDSWPVLSVPNLLRMDDLGVEYVAGYPAGITWLNDRLACVHGSKVRSSGSSAAAVIDDERVSIIFGHIHRIELQHKTSRVRSGPRTRFAASPGCLCRVDGAVPSTKGAVDPLGRAVTTYENWQQGVGVVTYRDGDAPFALELVPIHDGFALFRGRDVEATSVALEAA